MQESQGAGAAQSTHHKPTMHSHIDAHSHTHHIVSMKSQRNHSNDHMFASLTIYSVPHHALIHLLQTCFPLNTPTIHSPPTHHPTLQWSPVTLSHSLAPLTQHATTYVTPTHSTNNHELNKHSPHTHHVPMLPPFTHSLTMHPLFQLALTIHLP